MSGFCEGSKYRIRKPAESVRLLIDDEPSVTEDGDWTWSPGFYAGEVRAQLLGKDDKVLAKYMLDVSPHPEKAGREMFQAMLDQIWKFDPSLVLGTEPAAIQVGHEADFSDYWLEYARIREYSDVFLPALQAISRQPLQELKAEWAKMLLLHVRRADRRTAQAALASAQRFSVLGPGFATARPTSASDSQDVPVVRETLDGVGNRCIAAVAHAVSLRAACVRNHLQRIVQDEPDSTTHSTLAARWQRRRDFLDRIAECLRYFQRNSPLPT